MEEIVVISVCLVLNALFASFEMAFVAVPRAELRKLAYKGNKDAQRILNLRENPERILSIIQVGITLVGAISAGVAGAGAAENLEPYLMERFGIGSVAAEAIAIALVVLPITFLLVILGELVPKTLALRDPVRITLRGARWLFLADRTLAPAVTVMEWSTNQVIRVFFPKTPPRPLHAEAAVDLEALSEHHQTAVMNLAKLERIQLKNILVPWKSVISVRTEQTMTEIAQAIFSSGHTRFPVLHQDRVSGILHTKEFLALRESGETAWTPLVRPALWAQPGDDALTCLRVMQSRHNHMAIVVSRDGEPMGIVTMEDIFEEIWGEIQDEAEDHRARKLLAERFKTKSLGSNPIGTEPKKKDP